MWQRSTTTLLLVVGAGAGCGGGGGGSLPARPPEGTPAAAAEKPVSVARGGGTVSSVGAAAGGEAVCSVDGWCWRNPWPQGNRLNDVTGGEDRSWWTVGDRGTVLERTAAGAWRAHAVGTEAELEGVWARGGTVVAVGHGVIAERSGETWRLVDTGDDKLQAVGAATDDEVVWAVGRAGALWARRDGTWSRATSGVENNLEAVWGHAANDVYAVGEEVVLHFDGATWSPSRRAPKDGLAKVTLLGVGGTAADDVYAVGWHRRDGQTVLHYDGATWSTEGKGTPGQIRTLYDVWSAEGQAFAVGTRVALRRDAQRWQRWSLPEGDFFGVGGLSSSDVLAVGARGQIYAYDGVVTPVSKGPTATLEAVAIDGAGTVWAAGEKGSVLRGGAEGYARVPLEGMNDDAPRLRGVATAGSEVVIVGDDSVVITISDGTPTVDDAGLGVDLHGVVFVGDVAVAVGADGVVARRRARTWERLKTATGEDLEAVWSDGTSAFAVGRRGTLLRIVGDAVTALPSGTDAHLFGVSGRGADDVVVVGRKGTVLRYDGSSFRKLPAVADPRGRPAWLTGVTPGDDGGYLIVGGNGTIARLVDGAIEAQASGVAGMLRAVVTKGPTQVVVGDHGAVLDRAR
ncbi:MAG: hypothetical protein AAF928_00695 [Myxococcota bacterium]